MDEDVAAVPSAAAPDEVAPSDKNAAALDDGSNKPLARRAAARRVTSFKEPTASDGEFFRFPFLSF